VDDESGEIGEVGELSEIEEADAAETRLPPGARLGPYQIVALLGAGGMGQVYVAHDPRLGRDVAIKVLSRHTPADRVQLRRFEREARAASALNHPNLLAVFDVGDQAMSYKGTRKTADQIGHELGVDYILESSLRGTGDRIRATAQLVRVRDQTHVWSQSYDRTMSDVVAMQTDIARAIAGKIQVQFASPAAASRARPRPVNRDAYLAYLQGRYHWNKRSREMLLQSIEDFQQAIRLDPAYPQAYAGLADSYLSLVLIAEPRPAELLDRARRAALAALRLDDAIAEAHTSLAYAKFYYDWDWPGAEAEFRRALTLNPGYATAHQWYAEYLGLMGRERAAIAEGGRALELDPLSLIINMEAGLPLPAAVRRRHRSFPEDPRSRSEFRARPLQSGRGLRRARRPAERHRGDRGGRAAG